MEVESVAVGVGYDDDGCDNDDDNFLLTMKNEAMSVTRVVHCSAYKGTCRPRFFILALMLFLIRDIYQHTSCFYIYSEDVTLPSCISCLLYTSPSPRDLSTSRMPSSA